MTYCARANTKAGKAQAAADRYGNQAVVIGAISKLSIAVVTPAPSDTSRGYSTSPHPTGTDAREGKTAIYQRGNGAVCGAVVANLPVSIITPAPCRTGGSHAAGVVSTGA